MALFPRLKTNAVAQFPTRQETTFATEVLQFIDGSEQRFRQFGRAVRRWMISLDVLDESEIAAIQDFHLSHLGSFGSFSFYDPWDEVEYSNCSFEGDELTTVLTSKGRGAVTFTIRRNVE